MSKSRQELEIMKKLADQLERYNQSQSSRLDEEQSIRDVLIDQTKQLGFQQTLKKDIRKASNDIYKLQADSIYEENKILGTRKASLKIEKDLATVEKSINTLNKNREILLSKQNKANNDIAISIEAQVKQAEKLKRELLTQKEISDETRKNFGVSGFQGLSEIFEKIGGKASQLSKPFEQMAEASRSTVEPLIARNKQIAQFQGVQQQLMDISKGNLEVTDKLANKLGLVDKAGKSLTGEKAKEAATNALKIGNNLGKPMSKARVGLKGLGAGFKALGGIISKALGPISLIITAVQFVQMIVQQMFKASQETAEFSRNFLMSRDAARELYMDSFKLVGNYNMMEMSEGRTVILREDMLKAHKAINNELGLSMNLMTGLGDATGQDVAEVGKLMKHFGLSEKAAGKVFIQAQATGRSVKEYAKDLYGDLAVMSARTGVQMDFNKLIDEASGVSGRLRHNMGGTVDNIAKSLFQAKLMGIELNNLQVNAMGLLDLESSLKKEIELEAILGKEIDGENLRKIAMHGTELDLVKAIMRETKHLGGFLNMNRLEQEAFAQLTGLSSDHIFDIIYNEREMAALRAKHAKIMEGFQEHKNSLLAQGIDISNDAAFMEKYNLSQQYDYLVSLGKTEQEIRDTLYDSVQQYKEEESAGEKWAKTVEIIKETIAKMVGDGSGLDRMIDRFENFFNSNLMRLMLGIDDVDHAKGLIESDIDENKGKAMAKEVSTAIQEGFEFYDPHTGEGFKIQDKVTQNIKLSEEEMDLASTFSRQSPGQNLAEVVGAQREVMYGEGSVESKLKSLYTSGLIDVEKFDKISKMDAGAQSSELTQLIDLLTSTQGKLSAITSQTGLTDFSGELGRQLMSEGTFSITNEQFASLNDQFLHVGSLITKNNSITEESLREQVTPEHLEAMFPELEDRFKVAIAKEAFDEISTLTENQKQLLLYVKDYSKSAEDQEAARDIALTVDPLRARELGLLDPAKQTKSEKRQELKTSTYNSAASFGMASVRSPYMDFIQRPGQTPIRFNENDIIIGGTNLLSTSGGTTGGGTTNGDDSYLVGLLERLITVVQNGTTIQLDGNKLGQGLVLGASRIGTTVR